MCGIASPKGEQAKTDADRIKKSLVELRESRQVEDREFNAYTIRAYWFAKLSADIFTFSLAPSTNNESKTLKRLTRRTISGGRISVTRRQPPLVLATNAVRRGAGLGRRGWLASLGLPPSLLSSSLPTSICFFCLPLSVTI